MFPSQPPQYRHPSTVRRIEPLREQHKVNKVEIVAGLILMVAFFSWLILFTDRVVMPLIAHQGVEVSLPRFVHLPIATADSIALENGLELKRAGTRVDDTVLPGWVVDQSPAPGVTVKRGRIIDIVLSVRPERVLCPNLVGKAPSDAQLIADSTGLKINDKATTYQFSTSHPEGVVMKQLPPAGESVNKGEPVSLTVSMGREPRDNEIVAPSLVGRMQDEIKVLLMMHKVQLGTVEQVKDPSVPANTIVAQEPASGKKMAVDGKVNIKVATGGEAVTATDKPTPKTVPKKETKTESKSKGKAAKPDKKAKGKTTP